MDDRRGTWGTLDRLPRSKFETLNGLGNGGRITVSCPYWESQLCTCTVTLREDCTPGWQIVTVFAFSHPSPLALCANLVSAPSLLFLFLIQTLAESV